MPADTQHPSPSNGTFWAGAIISGLVALFLTFDGLGKIIKLAPVVEGSERLGVPASTLLGIGAVLLACTALYAIPRTAALGAILLTGYLGGAAAIHVRAASGVFPVVFSVGMGILVWVGLILREPRVLAIILPRP